MVGIQHLKVGNATFRKMIIHLWDILDDNDDTAAQNLARQLKQMADEQAGGSSTFSIIVNER